MKGELSKIHGVTTVGERGQIVIPAKLRKLFNIKSGEELIVIANPIMKMVGFIPADMFAKFVSEAAELLTTLEGKSSKKKKR